jgi:hypothetical protein
MWQSEKAAPRPSGPSTRRLFLKQHRDSELGFTLEEVGARMGGKNKSYVSRIERGGS